MRPLKGRIEVSSIYGLATCGRGRMGIMVGSSGKTSRLTFTLVVAIETATAAFSASPAHLPKTSKIRLDDQ